MAIFSNLCFLDQNLSRIPKKFCLTAENVIFTHKIAIFYYSIVFKTMSII